MTLPISLPVYQKLAREIERHKRCAGGESHWKEFADEALDVIRRIESDILPSGSGFDSGSTVDVDESTPDRIVIRTDFHHMNDVGYYDKWTSHRVIVTPSLAFGMELRVTGKNFRDIKDYIGDVFSHCLNSETKGI